MEMIFSQYKETSKLLLNYPKIGGEDIKDFVKKTIRNILHANIDVYSRSLISGFPGDGVKCISKLQSHCASMTFSDKSRYEKIFQLVMHKVGESAMNYIKILKNAQVFQIQ